MSNNALMALFLSIGFFINGCQSDVHKESNTNENFSPLDTIPILNDTIYGTETGYYKLVYGDGSLQRLDFLCGGRAQGIVLFFRENGVLDAYTEYEDDNNTLRILFDETGKVTYGNYSKSLVFFDGTDTVPDFMQDKLDFSMKYCPSVDKINWEKVLVNRCD
jgi:hypothetical protein